MLTFLRKIRKSLIESGSTRKYIIYAIGEIALVVIGILIALQINIWNQEREMHITEKIYLDRINDDVNSMLIASAIFEDGQEFLDKSLTAVKVLENCFMTEEEQIILEFTLNHHQLLGLFPIERTTYDEMLSTGMIAHLRNDSLKTMISGLYSSIEAAQNRLNYFRDELGRASGVIMEHVLFTINNNEFATLSYEFDLLCKNIQFRNAVVEIFDARSDTYYLGSDLRERLKVMKTTLEKELKKDN